MTGPRRVASQGFVGGRTTRQIALQGLAPGPAVQPPVGGHRHRRKRRRDTDNDVILFLLR